MKRLLKNIVSVLWSLVYLGSTKLFHWRGFHFHLVERFSPDTEEGDGYGIGFSAGYSYMLHPNLNLEFGVGLWTGVKKYTAYDCPSCGVTTGSGTKSFIMPNELLLSLVYVF